MTDEYHNYNAKLITNFYDNDPKIASERQSPMNCNFTRHNYNAIIITNFYGNTQISFEHSINTLQLKYRVMTILLVIITTQCQLQLTPATIIYKFPLNILATLSTVIEISSNKDFTHICSIITQN